MEQLSYPMNLDSSLTLFNHDGIDHLTNYNNFPTPYLHTLLSFSFIASSGLPFIKVSPSSADILVSFLLASQIHLQIFLAASVE